MKKINLILSAVAAVALLASCSNETPKEWTNVKNHDYKYSYTVTGTMTTTNKSGTTTSYSTDKTVETIKQAVATVTYDEDALDGSNYEYYNITIDGVANYVNTYTPAGSTSANPSTKWTDDFGVASYYESGEETTKAAGWYDISEQTVFDYIAQGNMDEAGYDYFMNLLPLSTTEDDPVYSDPNDSSYVGGAFWFAGYTDRWVRYWVPYIADVEIEIREFGGDYFINFDNEYIALPEEAFDGFIGDDEFTLTYSTKKDNRLYNLNQAGYENAGNNLNTTDTEYSFTFKKVNVEE